MGLSSKEVSGDHLELNWPQTMLGSDSLELQKPRMKRQLQTQQSDPLKCPRCESTNTKFCYYNNYNKTQPRHFCKACKRHWTKGGTLRNVPIGGGRKNKRIKRPSTTAAASTTTTTTTLSPMAIRNSSYIGHNVHPLGLSDHKDILSDATKASFFKPVDSEGRNVLESYTDIEELKGQVSWDFNGNFIGCVQQLPHQIHQTLGFSIVETNPNPIIPSSFPSLTAYNEDSTITTTRMSMPSSSSSQPWQVPSTSNFLESNYWNWNDIDTMVLADLNKPFEDPQFKP